MAAMSAGTLLKGAAAESFVGDLAKPSFHQVQPGTGSRNEMQMEAGMPLQPGLNARMFVGPVVVHDQMQIHLGRSLGIDRLEEPDKLLMAMPRHAVADDSAVERDQGGKQRRRAVALVVVGHGAATPFFSGSPGCVRSSAWIWDFSSTHSTSALSGGLRYSPTTS